MSTVAARETIAACLIVCDEQERLPAALASVAFCDEVIVVDSGSRDRTVEIARAAGARVVEHPWAGFGAQRNVAIDHASADWILEVDADERITPELARELTEFLRDAPAELAIGVLPMREWFLGRLLANSIKYPRYRARLFRRGAYRHDERRKVHEGIWPCGPTWVARADMHHILAGSPREAFGDWWRYAGLQAASAPKLSGAARARAIVLRPLAKLAYRTVVDEGWRDGGRGMLKIVLDCAGDALVWLRRPSGRGERAESDAKHFGREEPRHGPVRLLAVAAGEADARRALTWLTAARRAGADVTIVTDARLAGDGDAHGPTGAGHLQSTALAADDDGRPLLVIPLARFTRPALWRALDVAGQIRPVDGLVLAAGRPRRAARWLPATVRAAADPLPLERDAEAVVASVTERCRANGPEPAPRGPADGPDASASAAARSRRG